MALLELMKKKGRSLRNKRKNYESIMLYPAVGDTEHDEIKVNLKPFFLLLARKGSVMKN